MDSKKRNKEEPDILDKCITKIKSLRWQDWVFILFILLIFSFQISQLTKLQHLPGPIFGGDIYRERGYTEHIIRGNSPFSDPLFLEEINYFPWLGHYVGALTTDIFSSNVEKVLAFTPAFITLLAGLGFYLLGQIIFKKKEYALMLMGIAIATNPYNTKITSGLGLVFAIFSLYYWFKTKETKTIKDSIFLGLFIGLAALTHGSVFINILVFLASLIGMEVIWTIKEKKFSIKEIIKKYLPAGVVSISISLIFFLPLIIKYSMVTLNNSYAYALTDINKLGYFWVVKKLFKVFFNFSSISKGIMGLIVLLGLVYVLLTFKKEKSRLIAALFFGTILSGAHYIITKPLFNKWMEPGHMISLLFIPSLLLFVYGINFINLNLKKFVKKTKVIIFLLVILIITLAFVSSINSYNNSRWVQYGRSMDGSTASILNLGEWIKSNTNKEDIFLAHDETSFALNAVSGAKVVMSRRVHASYFVDVNKRYADGIVMLYGNNPETTQNLVKEYNVQYVYVDQHLLNTPMITELKYGAYLTENGINYSIMNVRWDPSTADAPTFDSLVIPPQELKIINLVQPLKEIKMGDQTTGLLYQVK